MNMFFLIRSVMGRKATTPFVDGMLASALLLTFWWQIGACSLISDGGQQGTEQACACVSVAGSNRTLFEEKARDVGDVDLFTTEYGSYCADWEAGNCEVYNCTDVIKRAPRLACKSMHPKVKEGAWCCHSW